MKSLLYSLPLRWISVSSSAYFICFLVDSSAAASISSWVKPDANLASTHSLYSFSICAFSGFSAEYPCSWSFSVPILMNEILASCLSVPRYLSHEFHFNLSTKSNHDGASSLQSPTIPCMMIPYHFKASVVANSSIGFSSIRSGFSGLKRSLILLNWCISDS